MTLPRQHPVRLLLVGSSLLLASAALSSAISTTPRQVVLFDQEWRFAKGAFVGAGEPTFDDADWRAVDLPHDWGIEDLPSPAPDAQRTHLFAVAGTWRFHRGDDPAWAAPSADVSTWETVTLPTTWEKHSDLRADDVFGWYRRTLAVPAELRDKDLVLELGWIDDADETYFNGTLIGRTGEFPPAFRSASAERRCYRVSKELVRFGADNVVAVRVFDHTGNGGLYAAAAPRVVCGPFDSESPGSINTGFTIGGTGWYRKHFRVPAEWMQRLVRVRFDGVYMNADVWLNGHHLGNHPCGYTPAAYDLTPHLRCDGDNVLAVEVKNEGRNSRWYAGSGIYRHVWLEALPALRIAPDGVAITTPEADNAGATVRIRTSLADPADNAGPVALVTSLVDTDGRTVASARVEQAQAENDQTLAVAAPRLWSPDSPSLYRAVSELVAAGVVVDRVETTFGIRTIRFDADKGFFLNGHRLKLRGGCMHENNGPLGSAAFDRAEERRAELLKAAGFNAVRCAHNPPAPAFLDACDRLGLLVIDEAFDAWNVAHMPQVPDDYWLHFKDWWQRDLAAMLKRDRNHPSVILWSIGNQITDCTQELGARTARALADFVRAMEPTRPVTSNVFTYPQDWRKADPFFAALDVGGYSYAGDRFDEDHRRLPGRVILASEVASRESFLNWTRVLDRDFVAGNFEWTAFDYLGEVWTGWSGFGLHETELVPWTTAYCGDFDLCGFRKPRSFYRDALWSERPALALFVQAPVPSFPGVNRSRWGWDDVKPSWTWPGQEGKPLQVDIYSNCETVRLRLNGRDLGEQATSRATEFKTSFKVPFEAGLLEAIGFVGGHETARAVLRTAGEPAALRLTADRTQLRADGQDLAYVTVEIVDAAGVPCPAAAVGIRFTIEGTGSLAAVGNSNPRGFASFRQPQCAAYEGRCLAIVRTGERPGTITLSASAEGLDRASITLRSSP